MPIVIGEISKKPRLYGWRKIKNRIYNENLISKNLKKASEAKARLEAEKASSEAQLKISAAKKLYLESGLPYIGK